MLENMFLISALSSSAGDILTNFTGLFKGFSMALSGLEVYEQIITVLKLSKGLDSMFILKFCAPKRASMLPSKASSACYWC